MIDVHPDDPDKLKLCLCKSAWVRVPGKHRNQDIAWDAFEAMIATRH
jgi:hypothetical protein